MARKDRAKRNTYNYSLKQRRKIVYHGISQNLGTVAARHKRSRKRFTHVAVDPYPSSRQTARKRERKRIATYEKTHGRKPRYNKRG